MTSTAELATVVDRMIQAGWPDATAMCGTGHGTIEARENWRTLLEGVAGRYLTSTQLHVDTLIQLGPLARESVAAALDLAGWEGDVPIAASEE